MDITEDSYAVFLSHALLIHPWVFLGIPEHADRSRAAHLLDEKRNARWQRRPASRMMRPACRVVRGAGRFTAFTAFNVLFLK
jgi:hypothetical protein